MSDKRKVLDNPDSTGVLAPIAGSGLTFGFVDEMHGRYGEVLPDFDATRSELCAIVRAHATEILDRKVSIFFDAMIGSTDMRLIPYLNCRINRLAEILGEDEVKSVWQEVEASKQRKLGDQLWEIFSKDLVDKRDQLLEDESKAAHAEDHVDE